MTATYTLAIVLIRFRNNGFPGEEDFCNKKLSFCKTVVQNGVNVISVGVGNVNTYKFCALVSGVFRFHSSSFFLHFVVHQL